MLQAIKRLLNPILPSTIVHRHQFGPMQKSPFGWGQQCESCLGWKWRDSDEDNARLCRAEFETRVRRTADCARKP